jgi:hypothetical protein
MQVTYRPYKRACSCYLSSLSDDAHCVTCRCVRQQTAVNCSPEILSAYVHIDVVVKSSELASMHEDVKFKFISFFDATAQKLDMKIMYIKTIIKEYVMK